MERTRDGNARVAKGHGAAAPRVEIPAGDDEQPAWTRVGIVAAACFVVGIAWPRLAGVQVGPGVPGSDRPTADVSPAGSASAAPVAGATGSSQATPPLAGSAGPTAQNKQLVVVGPGRITKCSDAKGKKLEECGKLLFDPLAVPRLRELATCPAAIGLEGKLGVGFDIDFEKKEVHVVRVGKKSSLPSSTVQGVLSCAGQEFANLALDEVPHDHRRYTLAYDLSFHPPGKHPAAPANEQAGEEGAKEGDDAKGSTTNETDASGSATVSWDTALLRKEPKDGDVVARVVRGTRVKILGRQHDWYRVESNGKTGWVYRGAIGL